MQKDSSFGWQRVGVWIHVIFIALTGHSHAGWTNIVQLVRNFLCCIKDLALFGSTFLYNPFLLDIAPPLHKTTWLEALISITQLYACISVTRSGALMLNSSLGKLRRVTRLLQLQSKNATLKSRKLSPATFIVNEHLIKTQSSARRTVVISACLLTIGPAFFWLFANSWHVSEVNWIGGLDALISALTTMEIALVVLLCFMFDDAREMLKKSNRMTSFVTVLKQDKLPQIGDAERYAWMVDGGWTPFWAADVGVLHATATEEQAELKLLNDEISKISQDVMKLVEDSDGDGEEKPGRRKGRSRSRERRKSADGGRNARTAAAGERIEEESATLRLEAVREFIFFALNFAAFYGYMLCIVAYHWRHHKQSEQPAYIQALKLGMSNDDADWHGNFFGDLMWTIEPAVAMVSPAVIAALKPVPVRAKAKTD